MNQPPNIPTEIVGGSTSARLSYLANWTILTLNQLHNAHVRSGTCDAADPRGCPTCDPTRLRQGCRRHMGNRRRRTGWTTAGR